MLTTLQPLAAAAGVPAAATSFQQPFSATASSPAPAAVAQPAAAQAPPLPPAVPEYRKSGEWVVTWQVEAEDRNGATVWRDYDEAFQEKLENQMRHGPSNFRHTPGDNVQFTYDTKEMYQMNMETSKKRLIRRCLIHSPEWLQMDRRMRENAEANAQHWDLTPYYQRTGKGGGKGHWKGSRSRSVTRR
jgi:hypothetical protein